MTIYSALRSYLLADAGIAAVVVARAYALRLPQKAVFPAIVLTMISGVRANILRGPASMARPRFQVDCWHTTLDAAHALGSLCRQRLEGYVGDWSDGGSPATIIGVAIEFEDERDLFEEDIQGGVCRHSADYFLSHGTAGGTI